MKAVQLVNHGVPGRFQFCELPDPQPGPEDVVLQVEVCGLNRLDLWAEEGALPVPMALPRVLGGEIAGRIMALGKYVDRWRLGERVAVQSNLSCGGCEFCERGDESLCLKLELLGVQRDGGFAEQVVVPWRSLIRLPDGVSFETSAALTLAGTTAMGMLTDQIEVHSGDWVLVIAGASGIGSAAIQIAKQLGARVISTGSTEAKRALASRLGADYVMDSNLRNWPAQVRKITKKRGVDLVVEHVGGRVLEQVFKCLARGGAVVTCGATSGRKIRLNLWPFFTKEHRLIGSYGHNRVNSVVALEWAADGKLKPVIDRIFPLAETPQAFAHLRQRHVLGKVLIKA